MKLVVPTPARMTMAAGTLTWFGSELSNCTVRFVAVIGSRVIVAVTNPPSTTLLDESVRVTRRWFESRTVSELVAESYPEEEATIWATCGPSNSRSACAVTKNVALAWPAGMSTAEGTVASVVSELVSDTSRSAILLPLRVTVALTLGFTAFSAICDWESVMVNAPGTMTAIGLMKVLLLSRISFSEPPESVWTTR